MIYYDKPIFHLRRDLSGNAMIVLNLSNSLRFIQRGVRTIFLAKKSSLVVKKKYSRKILHQNIHI